MTFSRRTAWEREVTALSAAVMVRRAAGLPLLDLAASNPTHCGFSYDAADILAPLATEHSLRYDPEALGLPEARAAVCDYYCEHGAVVQPGQICLTTSTSEAYSFLFRLLCDPCDEVLIARPSYPLFDFLADLDDVRLVTYPLFYDHGWQTEPGALAARISERTRAIVVVHPNNPTGHYTSLAERAELERLCVQHSLALIVDEVFLDYPLRAASPSFVHAEHPALTFVLSGLSKVAALPQMKASWIVTLGPERQREEALARLELIADTFLSMNAPVQHALGPWLSGRATLQQQIRDRSLANLVRLDDLLATSVPISRLELEAGWCAVLRVPALGPGSDDELVLALVKRWGVLVHPGHYYGFSGEGWLVVSLLPPMHVFKQGMESIVAVCAERLSAADGQSTPA